jgi:DTW domain-containing protein YfiP
MTLWLTLYTGRNTFVAAFSSFHKRTAASSRVSSASSSLSSYSSSSSSSNSSSSSRSFLDPDYFLHQVETTVQNVLTQYDNSTDILQLQSQEREALGVARHLNARLQSLRNNNDCPRCWLQRAHCICEQCPPIIHASSSGGSSSSSRGNNSLNRIFLLMHHKEIAMKVDTAKLILAAFPEQCRLVVGGIGPEYQASMKELIQAVTEETNKCLVLFPQDNAKSIAHIRTEDAVIRTEDAANANYEDTTLLQYDLVVLDGTWAQAGKLHSRYIPSYENGGPRRVELSQQAVATLEQADDQSGHQLRRHSVAWKQVGTFEATRLFLRDLQGEMTKNDSYSADPKVHVWKQIERYQEIANQAARRELGPPRESRQE